MDYEKRAKRQWLRVIISETVMVIAVIATVAVLALVVSGYWLNGNFEVERQGMLQINSAPTGADITIDGDKLRFQHTNSSKLLTSGEHTVLLSREGYDTWTKNVNITKGLLYRLNYPRLFLQEREKEDVYDATGTTFATVSPSRQYILLVNNTTEWTLINLDSNTITPTSIDISKIFNSVSLATGAKTGLFTGQILSAEWDTNNEHVLFKVKNSESVEWVLLTVKNPDRSINITREFATTFDSIKIFDNSASNLMVVRGGNLHKIDVGSRQITASLISNVKNYDFYDNEIIYSTDEEIGILRLGDEKPMALEDFSAPARVLFSKFYDEKYIIVINDGKLVIYKKDDLSNVASATLSFIPTNVKIGYEGDFIFLQNETHFATFDMESMKLSEWMPDSKHFGWINNYMVYAVKDGELIVYDFDGLNRRSISTNVSEHFPVSITGDRYMYYFYDNQLVREWLVKR